MRACCCWCPIALVAIERRLGRLPRRIEGRGEQARLARSRFRGSNPRVPTFALRTRIGGQKTPIAGTLASGSVAQGSGVER